MRSRGIVILWSVGALLLSGCGSGSATGSGSSTTTTHSATSATASSLAATPTTAATPTPAATPAPAATSTPVTAAATVMPTATPATAAAPAKSGGSGTSMCVQSTYYPISTNNQWVYQITGLPGGVIRQTTQTVTNVTPTTFTMQFQSPPGAPIDVKWLCTPNGLASATLNSGIGGPSTPQTMTMTVTKETGVWIPPDADWAVGKKWTVSYDVATTMTATTSVKSTGTMTVDFTIASQEPITVPGGTFNNAFKVHEIITENLTMNFNGKSIPLKTVGNVDAWFAANVGQVKSVTTTAGGSPIDEVLTSYHIQ